MEQCIYLKVSEKKLIILVLYVDDILLSSNDIGLGYETDRFYLRPVRRKILVRYLLYSALKFIETDRMVCWDCLKRHILILCKRFTMYNY